MIHRFINSGIELFSRDVARFVSQLVEDPLQTFRACPALFSYGSRMGIERHNAHFFVITQTARPSKSSMALRAEAGRSRAQLIETFSITFSYVSFCQSIQLPYRAPVSAFKYR
jgi:hypothetical protein